MEISGGSISLTLPPALLAEVAAAAEQEHRSVGDVLRELVEQALQQRRSKEADATLEKLLLEGLESELVAVNEDFWADLNAETDQLLAAHRSRKTPV